jgi:hypothetical protein
MLLHSKEFDSRHGRIVNLCKYAHQTFWMLQNRSWNRKMEVWRERKRKRLVLICFVCCSHAADYNDELESNEKPPLPRVSGSTNDLRGSGAEARTSGSAAPKFQKGTVSVRSAGSLVRVFSPLFLLKVVQSFRFVPEWTSSGQQSESWSSDNSCC